MKALVLCGGRGTRLGERCDATPKPLLSLGPFSIVEHILEQLEVAGIRDVFINLHYRGEQIRERLGTGASHGVRISYLEEESLLGTAGTARSLRDRLGGSPLLVHYGDIVTNHPLAEFAAAHARRRAGATALLHERSNSNSRAWLDSDGRVREFEERPEHALEPGRQRPRAFSGIALLSPDTVHSLPTHTPADLPRHVFPQLARQGRLFGRPLRGYRWAIDSPERLETARRTLANRAHTQWERTEFLDRNAA